MILCCGEALIDMLPDLNVQGEHVLKPVTGGSVFNTAIALGRLNEKTGFLSGVSTDGFGRQLIGDLENANVDHSFCVRSARPTTLAVVDISSGDATYTFYDEGSAGRMITKSDLPVIPSEVSTMMFGGISLIPDPCGETYEELLIKNSTDKLIYLDPNIRPGFIDNETAFRKRISRMMAHSDIIKISADDLEWLEPDLSPKEAIAKILEGNTSIILYSLGADGSQAHRRGSIVQAETVKITVADTVGAGDTFSGGFLASLNSQLDLKNLDLESLDDEVLQSALLFANKAAAITASRVGANPPRLDEIPS